MLVAHAGFHGIQLHDPPTTAALTERKSPVCIEEPTDLLLYTIISIMRVIL